MKKRFTSFISIMFALTATAQTGSDFSLTFDDKEDSLSVKTVDEIINELQGMTMRKERGRHFSDVWGKRTFWNIGYNTSKFSPKEVIFTGVVDNGGIVPDLKSDWGVSVQFGRNYRLHKTPIANTVQFYFDWTYIDLNVNHFSANGMYDSGVIKPSENILDLNNNYVYAPWNMEKYEANYGMSLGLSVTVAPFNFVNASWLHYLKFNLGYHIGYRASVLNMMYDEDLDYNTTRKLEHQVDYALRLQTIEAMPAGVEKDDAMETLLDDMQNDRSLNAKEISDNLSLGHGLMQSFGISMSWKAIGIGYECRMGRLTYKSPSTATFGSDKYKFNTTDSRIFIQFRL